MPLYVLRRDHDGKFVSRAGSAHSYTRLLQEARTFFTREEAESWKCGNEYVVDVGKIIDEPRGE